MPRAKASAPIYVHAWTGEGDERFKDSVEKKMQGKRPKENSRQKKIHARIRPQTLESPVCLHGAQRRVVRVHRIVRRPAQLEGNRAA
jgi:hypothetical protein